MEKSKILFVIVIVLSISLLAGCFAGGNDGIILEEADIQSNDPGKKDMGLEQKDALKQEPPASAKKEQQAELAEAPEETAETEEIKKAKQESGLPEIELLIISGPEYAQGGLVCYYKVKADIKSEALADIKFNRDDSNGSWGKNIARINLMEGESFDLICEAENAQGIVSESITLSWEAPDDDAIQKAEETAMVIESSDPADFLIDVDLSLQRVDVYYKDEIIKSMLCSGGKPETPTPTGTFQTEQKIEYSYVERFGQAAYYWTRFYGAYLFHSVPYDQEGNLEIEELAKIGSPASHGCIRLYLEDAKWMYDNLPLGVTVFIEN